MEKLSTVSKNKTVAQIMNSLLPNSDWNWRRTKEPFDESERGDWKSWLKIQHSEKMMASGPITSWQKRWRNYGKSDRLYLFGLQNHCRHDCGHEIKRHLLLGRKTMTNLESKLKSRDIFLPKKVLIVKAMVFPVVMYASEIWIIKKAEHQRIDVF